MRARSYADKLPLVSAVACYGGGVFVAAGPDLLFLKDSKTNGIADVRNVIFSGFGSTNPGNRLGPAEQLQLGPGQSHSRRVRRRGGFVPATSAAGRRPGFLEQRGFLL